MAEPWSGQALQALPATVLDALGALGSEFLREWEAQDMRVTLFKLLLLWLVLSLLGIQLAWGFYGNTVTGLYHRPGEASYKLPWAGRPRPHPLPTVSLGSPTILQEAHQNLTLVHGLTTLNASDHEAKPGLGGQNGSTPDGSTHFPSWEMAANEPLKTHRE
ncbi:PREDICTED: T-cell leukemia translocation-altered gene protein isoform X1 [Mandrillus leucophaeus]|uniref:T-cell leukemia translocation-altered gene protein isoform X1 n=1 Tax=Mandrillus leucophaeus TaxID=9568 RepID=UPI0005F43A34|nr:PREDICTED: T-cell leukemia translocation-altered gene protein isoform X1 [Mandrillus leucophaeus]